MYFGYLLLLDENGCKLENLLDTEAIKNLGYVVGNLLMRKWKIIIF